MRMSSAIAVRSVFSTSVVRPSSAYARVRLRCVSAKSGFAAIDRWYTFTASSKRPSFASDAPIPESAAKALGLSPALKAAAILKAATLASYSARLKQARPSMVAADGASSPPASRFLEQLGGPEVAAALVELVGVAQQRLGGGLVGHRRIAVPAVERAAQLPRELPKPFAEGGEHRGVGRHRALREAQPAAAGRRAIYIAGEAVGGESGRQGARRSFGGKIEVELERMLAGGIEPQLPERAGDLLAQVRAEVHRGVAYRPTTTPLPRSAYSGNASVSSRTSRLMRATVASSRLVSTVSINPATFCISPTPNPRVVTAEVPSRMPLVTNGDCGSPGIVFLFTVIPARSSSCSASFPVSPLGRRSTSIRWLSVPPETIA